MSASCKSLTRADGLIDCINDGYRHNVKLSFKTIKKLVSRLSPVFSIPTVSRSSATFVVTIDESVLQKSRWKIFHNSLGGELDGASA